MHFVTYILSISLHLALFLAMLFWPDPAPLMLNKNMVQISLVDGMMGGGQAPSPVLGPQGKKAEIIAPSMPAPFDPKTPLAAPLNKMPLEAVDKQMLKPEQELESEIEEKAKPKMVEQPKPEIIAEEKAKAEAEIKAKAEAEEKAKEEAEIKIKAEAEKKIKAEAEIKAKAEAEAKAKAEAEAKAKAEAEKKAKAKAEAEKKAKAKAEAEKKATAKAEAEKKAKAEAEKKAKAKAVAEKKAKAKAAAEKKAKADPIKKALADAKVASSKEKMPNSGSAVERALAEAKRNAGGFEGGGGGQGKGEGGGGLKDIYIGQVMLAVRPNWGFASNVRENLMCSVRVTLDVRGDVLNAVIVNSSGNSLFDASSVNAVKKTGAEGNFPIPPNAEYQDLILSFNLSEMGY